MKRLIEYTPPKMAPLPGEITNERVNSAILPHKIEAASRAIALCETLPELLQYREQAEGLAAAVKIMKKTAPDMVRAANNLVADAWRKGGELLEKYSNVIEPSKGPGTKGKVDPSPRGAVVRSLGLTKDDAVNMVRVAKAPFKMVREKAQRYASLSGVAREMPLVSPKQSNRVNTNSYREVMGHGAHCAGLSKALSNIRAISISTCSQLDVSERKLVRAKVTEIMELLDAIDEACK